MQQQNQIKRTLLHPKSIEIIRRHLASKYSHKNRASQSKALCQHFGYSDARAGLQIGGCKKVLRELERAGHVILPASSMPKTLKSPRRLAVAVPTPSMCLHFSGSEIREQSFNRPRRFSWLSGCRAASPVGRREPRISIMLFVAAILTADPF